MSNQPSTLRGLRQLKCLTLVQLSEASGVPHGNLSRIERGKEGVSVARVCAIARALNMPPGDVFTAIVAASGNTAANDESIAPGPH
jgi:transcriptional regulator with XRE-family HTH domain